MAGRSKKKRDRGKRKQKEIPQQLQSSQQPPQQVHEQLQFPELEDFLSGRFKMRSDLMQGYVNFDYDQRELELKHILKQRDIVGRDSIAADDLMEIVGCLKYYNNEFLDANITCTYVKHKSKQRPENLLYLVLSRMKMEPRDIRRTKSAFQAFESLVEFESKIYDALSSQVVRTGEENNNIVAAENYLHDLVNRTVDALHGMEQVIEADKEFKHVDKLGNDDKDFLADYKRKYILQEYPNYKPMLEKATDMQQQLNQRQGQQGDNVGDNADEQQELEEEPSEDQEEAVIEMVVDDNADEQKELEEEPSKDQNEAVIGESKTEKVHDCLLRYIINEKKEEEGLWQGCSRTSERCNLESTTFFVVSQEEMVLGLYNKLRDINNEFIVKPRLYLENFEKDQQSAIVLNGNMRTLSTWLEERKKDFGGGGLDIFMDFNAKKSWWKFIESDFKKIFRNVIRGLWYLLDSNSNIRFTNFSKDILVDDYRHAKLFPSSSCLELGINDNEDLLIRDETILNGLKDTMRMIIFAGFEDDGDLRAFDVPYELMVSFELLCPTKLSDLPCSWLINPCFFWECHERISFLDKVCELIDCKLIIGHDTVDAISYTRTAGLDLDCPIIYSFISKCLQSGTGDEPWWKQEIKRDCGSVFQEILDYNGGSQYQYPTDLARYMQNFLKHHNEKSYSHCNGGTLRKHEIEEKLNRRFPDYYSQISMVLFVYANKLWTKREKAVTELLSCFKSC